jgi:DNA-directed RNA polymerase alpha subunit
LPTISESARRAIARGVARGDSVADLEFLGLPQRTIGLLEESELEIITLRDLVTHSGDELLQIPNLGEKSIRLIFKCLAQYDQLDAIKAREDKLPA